MGKLPLHVAAQLRHADALLTLISNGADVNARDYEGYSPLHMAAKWGRADALLTLISNGARINTEDGPRKISLPLVESSTDFILHLLWVVSSSGRYSVHEDHMSLLDAARVGLREIVLDLISGGADVNAKSISGETLLYYAVELGLREIVLDLISGGADINAKTDRGMMPLHQAASDRNEEMVLTLISAGADVNAETRSGLTPLHFAASVGCTEMVLVLFSAGADINEMSNRRTPLDWALEKGHLATAACIREESAQRELRSISKLTSRNIDRLQEH